MSNTLQNVPLPQGVWVDLYDATGIAPGFELRLQNVGNNEIRVVVKATQPTDSDGFFILNRQQSASNNPGDAGAWAMCPLSDGSVNVQRYQI